jgi:hypothetical protein
MTTSASISTDALFYDNELDPLRVTVLAIGGPKKAAELLWGVNYKSGEQRVRDCLNPNRDEKFSFAEVITLARAGRDVGCHAAALYFNAEAGYAPPVAITPQDEQAELDRAVVERVGELRTLLDRYERIRTTTRSNKR